MASIIIMPKLGLTMTEGTVTKWYKNVGDEVKEGETVFEVTTDKLTNEVTADVSGILLKQYVEEGGEVPCKEPVALIGQSGESEPDNEINSTPISKQDALDNSVGGIVTDGTVMIMPKLGLTMTEGIVSKWYKNEGDEVKEGETVFEVTTDKLTNEITADVSGILIKKFVEEGGEVPCKEAVAIIGPEGTTYSFVNSNSPTSVDTAKETIKRNISVSASNIEGFVLASPAARKIAKDKKIDLSSVKATGPRGMVVMKDLENVSKTKTSPMAAKLAYDLGVDINSLDVDGRVMKADVLNAVKPISTQVKKEDKIIKLSGMRKTIARRMKESWETSPRVVYNMPIDTTAMKELKNKLSPTLKEKDIKLTFNHIMMKVVAKVLLEMPEVNSSIVGDEIILHPTANIGLAVALDNGLIVPNVKDCDTKSLAQIAIETEDKIKAAKSNKLSMEDMTGATFTISNLGMFGITSFSPIINQPEVAILGMCAITDTPVVIDSQIVIRPMMNLSLTADHRAVDGANAARFMKRIKELLENPYLLLV